MQFHLLHIRGHDVWHIPGYFLQRNFTGMNGGVSENNIIIIVPRQSESLLHSAQNFIIVLAKTENMFQRDSKTKCAFWIGMIDILTNPTS